MTPDEAAWVREHVWTQGMRKAYADTPGFYSTCACQYGLTHWCRHGQCDRCHRATPLRSVEASICTPGGMYPACFPEPYEHATDVSATGPRHTSEALVWLADRVCRWTCPCTCHAAPKPVQGGLFSLEAP